MLSLPPLISSKTNVPVELMWRLGELQLEASSPVVIHPVGTTVEFAASNLVQFVYFILSQHIPFKSSSADG